MAFDFDLSDDEGIEKSPPVENLAGSEADRSTLDEDEDASDVSIFSSGSEMENDGAPRGLMKRLQKTVEKIQLNIEAGTAFDDVIIELDEISDSDVLSDGHDSDDEKLVGRRRLRYNEHLELRLPNEFKFGFESEAQHRCETRMYNETFAEPVISESAIDEEDEACSLQIPAPIEHQTINLWEPLHIDSQEATEHEMWGPLLEMPDTTTTPTEQQSNSNVCNTMSVQFQTETNSSPCEEDKSHSAWEPLQIEVPESKPLSPSDYDFRKFVPKILPSGRVIRKFCNSSLKRVPKQVVKPLPQTKAPTFRNLKEYTNYLKSLAKNNPDVLKLIQKT